MANQTPAPGVVSMLERIRDARFAEGVQCPRCGSARVNRWGSFTGRQRYRCGACKRTFSDLTGTPAAYTKKLLLWSDYAERLAESATIRSAAHALGIAVSTSFRWRHVILTELRVADRETLSGVIELGDLWFAYSRKGERNLDPPVRTRGPRSRVMYPGEVVRVIVACDRKTRVVTEVAITDLVRFHDLIEALRNRIARQPIILASQGRLGPAGRFARELGGILVDVRRGVSFRPGSLWHLRTNLAYARRLLGWMRRFRGVATKYLANYLIWHRILDAVDRLDPASAVLRWDLTTGFT